MLSEKVMQCQPPRAFHLRFGAYSTMLPPRIIAVVFSSVCRCFVTKSLFFGAWHSFLSQGSICAPPRPPFISTAPAPSPSKPQLESQNGASQSLPFCLPATVEEGCRP